MLFNSFQSYLKTEEGKLKKLVLGCFKFYKITLNKEKLTDVVDSCCFQTY